MQAVTAVCDIAFRLCLLLDIFLYDDGCSAIIYTAKYCREL